ncbi:hypothetical protein, partial [Listeria monocytogenes]|uniref:hypothetical protein n=1 Tax=Listeria monocytogenes TaxID=1639 RepID=UPI000AE72A4B
SFKSVRATNDALEVKLDISQDTSTDKGNYTYALKNENTDVIDTEKVAAEDISKTVSLSMDPTSNYTLTVINPDNHPVALYQGNNDENNLKAEIKKDSFTLMRNNTADAKTTMTVTVEHKEL